MKLDADDSIEFRKCSTRNLSFRIMVMMSFFLVFIDHRGQNGGRLQANAYGSAASESANVYRRGSISVGDPSIVFARRGTAVDKGDAFFEGTIIPDATITKANSSNQQARTGLVSGTGRMRSASPQFTRDDFPALSASPMAGSQQNSRSPLPPPGRRNSLAPGSPLML